MALPNNLIQEKQWKDLQISSDDLQALSAFLFEKESPLPIDGLARVLISNRLDNARADLKKKQKDLGKIYLPKDTHPSGERLVFPQRSWESGTVTASHPGNNPEVGDFTVLTVEFADGSTTPSLTARQLWTRFGSNMDLKLGQNCALRWTSRPILCELVTHGFQSPC